MGITRTIMISKDDVDKIRGSIKNNEELTYNFPKAEFPSARIALQLCIRDCEQTIYSYVVNKDGLQLIYKQEEDILDILDDLPYVIEVESRVGTLNVRIDNVEHIIEKNSLKMSELISRLNNEELVRSSELLDGIGGWKKSFYIGTVFSVFPSGKYYMPFACSNLEECPECEGTGIIRTIDSEKTCVRCEGCGTYEGYVDQLFMDDLDQEAEKNGVIVECGVGDPTDMFISMYYDEDEVVLDEDGYPVLIDM